MRLNDTILLMSTSKLQGMYLVYDSANQVMLGNWKTRKRGNGNGNGNGNGKGRRKRKSIFLIGLLTTRRSYSRVARQAPRESGYTTKF